MKPKLPEFSSLQKYIKRIDDSRTYSNFGQLETDLRRRYSKLIGVEEDQIVLVNNGTQGLICAALMSGYGKVCIPAFTFAAAGALISQTRMKYKFVDINKKSWTIDEDPHDNEHLNLFVLPFGSSINNLNILEQPNMLIDAAASILNLNLKNVVMDSNLVIMVSLHATKLLGGGEGAILVCGSSEKAKELRKFTNFGFSSNRSIDIIGSNLKMSEYAAAVCHASLDLYEDTYKKWSDLNLKRNKINKLFDVTPDFLNSEDITPYWIVQLRNKGERSDLIDKLNKRKIEHRLWWGNGLYKEKPFRGESIQYFENADHVTDTYLGLPFYEDIDDLELSRIIEVLGS
jgi:dTDP-4-amino-4,6-dideoxygalactose transaminase